MKTGWCSGPTGARLKCESCPGTLEFRHRSASPRPYVCDCPCHSADTAGAGASRLVSTPNEIADITETDVEPWAEEMSEWADLLALADMEIPG